MEAQPTASQLSTSKLSAGTTTSHPSCHWTGQDPRQTITTSCHPPRLRPESAHPRLNPLGLHHTNHQPRQQTITAELCQNLSQLSHQNIQQLQLCLPHHPVQCLIQWQLWQLLLWQPGPAPPQALLLLAPTCLPSCLPTQCQLTLQWRPHLAWHTQGDLPALALTPSAGTLPAPPTCLSRPNSMPP